MVISIEVIALDSSGFEISNYSIGNCLHLDIVSYCLSMQPGLGIGWVLLFKNCLVSSTCSVS